MKRIFQHYQGDVHKLTGLSLVRLRCLVDANSEDVILIWLQSESKWMRIFIDGAYCGIDEYDTDESEIDTDDEVNWMERDSWVKGAVIQHAEVISQTLPEIKLEISLTNGSKLILNCDEQEYCTLSLKEK